MTIEDPTSGDARPERSPWLSAAAARTGVQLSGGEEFLVWAARALAEELGAELVAIGEFAGSGGFGGSDRSRIRTRVLLLDGELIPDIEYTLEGTPCERVVNADPCVFERDVAARFPHDELLAGYEGYVGVPLIGAGGRRLGVLSAMTRRPLADRSCVAALLELSGAIARHVESLQALRGLAHLIASPGRGEDGLADLAQRLVEALSLRAVAVCTLDRDQPGCVHVSALCERGRLREGVDISLEGSPSKLVYERGELFVASGVSERFPHGSLVNALSADGFYGRVVRDADGEPIGHVAIYHDRPLPRELTEQPLFEGFCARVSSELRRAREDGARSEVERSLLEAQRMESLGVLAGGIAHDFNNILVGVLGNASLAQRAAGADNAAQRPLAALVLAAERAAELVRKLLAYAGRGRGEREALDFGALVGDLGMLLDALVPSGVRLRFELAPDLPQVVGDATQLRQAVMNIVLNGAEAYAGRAGEVCVRTSTLRADAAMLAKARVGRDAAPGEFVCVEIRDTGAGMSEETIAKVFEPFFTTKFVGRGLGLAAVRGIVGAHGGAVLIDSQPEQGSTFWVLIPAAGRAKERLDEPAPALPAARGKVLVVDDEPAVRSTIAAMLEGLDCDAIEVGDGLAAVEIVKARDDVRFVLLDVTMPGQDGYATRRQLRDVRPELPIRLMTGYTELEADGGLADDEPFLAKPFHLRELSELLDHVFAGRDPATL